MPTVWWDDPRQFRIDAGSGPYAGSVPEEIPRERWSEWDKAKIGGMDVPGHVVVFSKKQKKSDVLSPMGQEGGTINHLGIEPVEMDITITLWTPAQFVAYEALIGLIMPKSFPHPHVPPPAGVSGPPEDPHTLTSANSVTVQHPPISMMGVTDIYINEIGSLIPGPVFGAKVSVWRATERKPEVQTPMLASSSLPYSADLLPQKQPVPTQPATKPSLSAAGP